MSDRQTQQSPPAPRLSEDWLAVIISLALAALVWSGAISRVPWPLIGLME